MPFLVMCVQETKTVKPSVVLIGCDDSTLHPTAVVINLDGVQVLAQSSSIDIGVTFASIMATYCVYVVDYKGMQKYIVVLQLYVLSLRVTSCLHIVSLLSVLLNLTLCIYWTVIYNVHQVSYDVVLSIICFHVGFIKCHRCDNSWYRCNSYCT